MFSRVLPKSLPQSVLAPWCAVLTAGFPKVWANIPRLLVDPFVLESCEPPGVSRCGAHGSVISWQHINLLGEYDFSDEKLRDSVGIRPPKLTP